MKPLKTSLLFPLLLGFTALLIIGVEIHSLSQGLMAGEIQYISKKFDIRITGYPALVIHLFVLSSGMLAGILATVNYKKNNVANKHQKNTQQ